MQIRKSILIAVIITACVCSYFNTLFALFVWDDNTYIVDNPYVKSFRFLPKFFSKDFVSVIDPSIFTGYYRPLLAGSFMLDYSIWRNNPFGYHLTNLIFHILVSVLVFLFVEVLSKGRIISFFSALLFSVHPIHTEAVSFISGRVDVITLAFYLFSLIWFLKYVSNRRFVFYALSLSFFFMSLLTKEMAITLPLVVFCIDYFFLSKRRIKDVIKNFPRFHVGFFVVLGLYLLIRFYVIGWSFVVEQVGYFANFFPGTAPFWRLFTVIKILTFYIRLLIFPYGLHIDYYFPAANSLFEPIVLLGLIILLLSAFVSIKSVKSYAILSFSILWFFVTVLPVSNIFPQRNIFAERYMYIPSVGFCIAIGFLFSWLLKKDLRTNYLNWKKTIFFVFFLLIAALGRVTYERNKVWENDLLLWYDTVKAVPNNHRAHLNLAIEYFKLNLSDKAKEEVKVALQLNPVFYEAYDFLGVIYFKAGLTDEAIKEYNTAIEIYPDRPSAYNNLAAAYIVKGQYKEAIDAGLTALEKNPHLKEAHYNLALSYTKIGMIDEAIGEFEEYLKLRPEHPGVHVDLGYLHYKKGDYEKTRAHWLEALKLSKDYEPAKEALKLLDKTK